MNNIIDIEQLRRDKDGTVKKGIVEAVEKLEKVVNDYINLLALQKESLHDRVIVLKYVIENYEKMGLTEQELDNVYFEYSVLCKMITKKIHSLSDEVCSIIEYYDERIDRIIK